jgi:hypothetical protein
MGLGLTIPKDFLITTTTTKTKFPANFVILGLKKLGIFWETIFKLSSTNLALGGGGGGEGGGGDLAKFSMSKI